MQGPAESSAPAAPAAGSSSAAAAGGGRIDLFRKESLCQALGCAGSGAAGSGGSQEQTLAEDQAQLAAQAAVTRGQVAPVWRELERDLERTFKPPLESASPATRGELFGQQLLRGAQAAPEKSRAGWLANRDPGNRVRAEILAAQEAYDEPSEGREAEVEVEVNADNQVTAVRLLRGSGSRRLDDEALRAVRQVVLRRPITDSPGPLRARFALRAEAAVNLPRVTAAVEENSGLVGGFTAGIAGTFDEVTRKATVRSPFAKRLQTRVRLISVRRSAPPPEGRSPEQ